MSASRRPLIAGNWKMNGLRRAEGELAAMIAGSATLSGAADLLICPPATLLCAFADLAEGSKLAIGAQDCHVAASGAHTGDLSAEMLADAGARFVIVGHSERRADHGESDATVRAKAQAAHRAGLVAIICVGETRAEREAGTALAVVAEQVRGSLPEEASAETVILAYEPVWAIGTGLVPTVEDVEAMHAEIRAVLAERMGTDAQATRILYGGSVKPDNAAELLQAADVDGALVGGASLKAADFLAIARAVD